MQYIYPFLISFMLIFFSELGDKTQILVISFSSKNKAKNILIGVALGTFFSHGIAILFGSKIGNLNNDYFLHCLKICTYITFLIFGIIGFIPKKEKKDTNSNKNTLINKLSKFTKSCIFIVALSIIVGELGDKTFLSSIGLGLQYPNYKLSLILGAVCGMVVSDSIAIFFGKLLGSKIPERIIEFISNLIFILFGIIGLLSVVI